MSSPVLSHQCCDALHIASHDRLALEAIVKMERFLTNYEAPPYKKGKTAETESTSKQESSKIYESTQRKKTFNPSWKESFPWLEYHVVNKEGKMFCFACRRYDRSSSFCVGSTNFKLDVWLQKKRIPYVGDNRSRLRREENDGPAEIPEDHDAHVCVEAQQELQRAVPSPSDDAKDDDDGNLLEYYFGDELVTNDKLIDQENEAYEKLT